MDKIICPSCGSATSFNPVRVTKQGILLSDRPSEKEIVRSKVRVTLIEEPYQYGVAQYGILWCAACEKNIVVEKAEYAAENDWRVVYPIARKVVSESIPPPIKSEFEEASLCFAVGAFRACASMCQRTLESLCQNKKVSGLNQLLSDGIISKTLFDRATEIRLWAGMTKHKPIADPVSREDAEQLLTYLDAILNAVYVESTRFDALRQKREQLEKKTS